MPRPSPGNTYVIRLAEGSALSQVKDSNKDIDVHFRPYEESGWDRQQWKVETTSDHLGFRNQHNHRLLGSDNGGHLQADATELKEWEQFTVQDSKGQLYLNVNKNGESYNIYRPHGEDRLVLSASEFTPVIFEEVSNA